MNGIASGLKPDFFTWLSKIAKNSYMLSHLEMLLVKQFITIITKYLIVIKTIKINLSSNKTFIL